MCGPAAAVALSQCRPGANHVLPAAPRQPSRVPGRAGRWEAVDMAGVSCDPEPLLQC